jgi:glycerate kinase
MASASGLTLVPRDQLNPMRATTYGTGELIQAALRHGARKLILAVGGSATVDGGVGAAMALGWQFLDDNGRPVEWGGGALDRIQSIKPPATPIVIPVEVLCDVNSPLTGPQGAAAVFGPQKGATPEMVRTLDCGLANLARMVRANLNMEIDTVPGAGAAGGLAAGAIAFMGAKLVPGIDTVIAISGLLDDLEGADWVITGEGRFDAQSLRGKVVSGIVKAAKRSGAKVAVIAGSVQVSPEECKTFGVEVARATASSGMPLDDALKQARPMLKETARRFF